MRPSGLDPSPRLAHPPVRPAGPPRRVLPAPRHGGLLQPRAREPQQLELDLRPAHVTGPER